jgi:hypothetical protein
MPLLHFYLIAISICDDICEARCILQSDGSKMMNMTPWGPKFLLCISIRFSALPEPVLSGLVPHLLTILLEDVCILSTGISIFIHGI